MFIYLFTLFYICVYIYIYTHTHARTLSMQTMLSQYPGPSRPVMYILFHLHKLQCRFDACSTYLPKRNSKSSI